MQDEIRMSMAKYRLERAEEAWERAFENISLNHYLLANNRIYYCVFYCMRSVLALEGLDFRKHSSVSSNFIRLYLKTNVFDRTWSDFILSAQEIRNDSYYEDFYDVSKSET